MENDLFMHSWLEMRLKDISSVVVEVQNYMFKKYNKEVEINLDFIISVLSKVYEPCNNLLEEVDISELNFAEPYYFKGLVSRSLGLKNVNKDITQILWKRIISLIYFLLKYVPKLRNIKRVLSKVEIMISQKKGCVNIINNEEENCIISAIINIISKLKKYNLSLNNNPKVSKYDVETSVNIILSKTSNLAIKDNVPDFTTFIDDTTGEISPIGEYNDNSDDESGSDILEHQLTKAIKNIKNLKPDDDYDDNSEFVFNEDEEQYNNKTSEGKGEFEDEDRFARIGDDDYTNNYDNDFSDNEDGARQDYNVSRKSRKRKINRSALLRPVQNLKRFEENQKAYFRMNEKYAKNKFEREKKLNKLALYLRQHDIVTSESYLGKKDIVRDDGFLLAEYILNGVDTIKNYKMSEKVKKNRINFFSSSI